MGIESTARHQSSRDGHPGASGGQCAFGQPMPAVRITVSIRKAGELVLVVRDLSSRETHDALRTLRTLFPRDEYTYTVDAIPVSAPGGGAA